MTDPDSLSGAGAVVDKLKALRAVQMAALWPAAEAAAESGSHEALVELIKVHTAIAALDFALANRPDPNAATRTRVGF